MKFSRNQPRSQPIVRVARLADPALVALLRSRRTSCLRRLSHLTPAAAVMPERGGAYSRAMSDKISPANAGSKGRPKVTAGPEQEEMPIHADLSNGDQVDRIVALSMAHKPSVDFGGYWQRHVRA